MQTTGDDKLAASWTVFTYFQLGTTASIRIAASRHYVTKWLEVPAGVVAQIQGHKPSATAEKHYKVRPLELLRVHHERIEAWILEQAKVTFDAKAEPGKLRVVAG
jgi:intergrase/recombinase